MFKYLQCMLFKGFFLGTLIFLTACSLVQPIEITPVIIPSPSNTPQPSLLAEFSFEVKTPPRTPTGANVILEVLDDVTGLAINPTRFSLVLKEPNIYTLRISFALGSVIKYRYIREGTPPAIEYTSQGKQVRYRMLVVSESKAISDQVIAWNDIPYQGVFGRIQGIVVDANSGSPLPDIFVVASGISTTTSADGSFLLEGITPGLHNLIAYSLDGSYKPYQQEAVVAVNSMTPASIKLTSSSYVNIAFIVHPPKDSLSGIPIRMLGDIFDLGNTFSDLNGGLSTIASRAPLLTSLSDGNYSIKLRLPIGLNLKYKYSLGDGFWNAEQTSDGRFCLRQLIVPSTDATVEDTIITWKTNNQAPILFNLDAPLNTPSGDTISIQFNPFGWTEPIPMWPLGNNRWTYILYSPLHLFPGFEYRYCRNDQCEFYDNANDKKFSSVKSSSTPQTINDSIPIWELWLPVDQPTTIIGADISPRTTSFFTGVEFLSEYDPTWQPYIAKALDTIQGIGSNSVILTPTWTHISNNPPVLEPVPGKDLTWEEISQIAYWSHQRGLNIILFPQTHFLTPSNLWWQNASRDESWWLSWFDRYETFILNYAQIAEKIGAKAFILGEPGALPALPKSELSATDSSDLPEYLKQRWQNLVRSVRSRYKGILIWATPFSTKLQAPSFVDEVDQVYIILSAPLSKSSNYSQADLDKNAIQLLDTDVKAFRESIGKPIIIGLEYPSIKSAGMGCISVGSECKLFSDVNLLLDHSSNILLDMQEQARIYSSLLNAINNRTWINGVISRGFYPPVAQQDKSASIHGKPASDILWYWFPRLIGK